MTDALLIPLKHYGVIHLSGQDAAKFLQGQLTCDIREVENHGSRLGAHCNIKGGMLTLYRVMTIPGGFLLRLNHDCLTSALQALNKYIIFSKATAEDVSQQFIGFGVMGTDSHSVVQRLNTTLPEQIDEAVQITGATVIKVAPERYEIWLDNDHSADFLPLLESTCTPGTLNDWYTAEISAGIPDLAPATQERFIPQMVNLQAIAGVSFNKGCYTGQEIVARLQYRGKLNRYMVAGTAEVDRLPIPGDTLFTPNKPGAGEVLQASWLHEGQTALIQAVVSKKEADEHSLHLHSEAGPALTLLPLPYTLDPALFERK